MGEQSELNKSIERIKGWQFAIKEEKGPYPKGVVCGLELCLNELKRLSKQEEISQSNNQET